MCPQLDRDALVYCTTTGTGEELEVEHLASTCPPETTTVPLRCKSATSGLHCLGRPPMETSWPLAAIGGDACEFGPSEKTATEKPHGQVTAATSELEKMEGVGTTLPPPGSDLDRPAMKRPTRECRTHSRRLVQAGTGPGPGTAAH